MSWHSKGRHKRLTRWLHYTGSFHCFLPIDLATSSQFIVDADPHRHSRLPSNQYSTSTYVVPHPRTQPSVVKQKHFLSVSAIVDSYLQSLVCSNPEVHVS